MLAAVSRPARSILVFGVLLLVSGAGLAFVPNAVLGLLGFPETREVWIRLAGILTAIAGFYDVRFARVEFRPFFRWSVQTRVVLGMFILGLVLFTDVEPQLLALAGLALAGAGWTFLELRRDAGQG
jgi:hypothetical protein